MTFHSCGRVAALWWVTNMNEWTDGMAIIKGLLQLDAGPRVQFSNPI